MYKVLIVAPNCGYDLAFGGGTFVALSQCMHAHIRILRKIS